MSPNYKGENSPKEPDGTKRKRKEKRTSRIQPSTYTRGFVHGDGDDAGNGEHPAGNMEGIAIEIPTNAHQASMAKTGRTRSTTCISLVPLLALNELDRDPRD